VKTSNKCLSVLIVVLFLGTASFMGVERMLMGHEPAAAAVATEIIDAEAHQSGDSRSAVVPGDGIRWNHVTLGLSHSFKRGVIEDSSIFRDIHLKFVDCWCSSRPFFKPFTGSEMFWFGLRYRKTDSDSLKSEDSSDYGNDCIYIEAMKYKEKQPYHDVDAYKKNILKAVEYPHGAWNYWSSHASCSEWTKDRWSTWVRVQLESCGNDSAKTLELRDQIRDRLFAYYKTLR
jgi:hypothetical protein